MKKVIKVCIAAIGLIAILFLIINNCIPRTDVFLGEYAVMENDSKLQMDVGVAGSMGYVGRHSTKKVGNELYVTFYSSLMGSNTIAGGNLITVDLFPECDAIYFNRNNDGEKFQRILEKNSETGVWERVTQ